MENSRVPKQCLEANTMAILDSGGVKDARDIHDDSLSFLEAVRGASLVSESSSSSTVPTRRMCNAVFAMFRRETASLEVLVACYQLLTDLDKRYPRVYRSEGGKGGVVVVKEAWSPLVRSLDNFLAEGGGGSKDSKCLFEPHTFSDLLQGIVSAATQKDPPISMKLLKDMMLVEYLINVIEGDFLPRQAGYNETSNWVLVRESLLNMVVSSRKLIFKSFLKDCLSIIYMRCHKITRSEHGQEGTVNLNSSLIAQSEIQQKTCTSIQKLIVLVMELDLIKKEADYLGKTSRADGVRPSAMEIILDELTYEDAVSPFFQGFSASKWKLEIILQYFWKYCSKPSTRTRNSNQCYGKATFSSILSYLTDSDNVKNISRRIAPEVARLLIIHAFQAYLYLDENFEHGPALKDGSLFEICTSTISAFQNLRKIDTDVDMSPLEKEAIFTAATILSMKT